MAAQMDTLVCDGCGATMSYDPGEEALRCEYCQAITEIPRAAILGDAAQLIIPLTVEQDELDRAIRQYLASGEYTPNDLVDRAVLRKRERFYVPGFIFRGEYAAQWSASFGYDRSESYVDYVRRTENGQTRREPVTKTRTVTDWRPASGSDTGAFAFIGYSGSQLPQKALDLVQLGVGIGGLKPYDVGYVSGVDTETATLTELDTYKNRVEGRLNAHIEASVKNHAQGDHQRDWHWTARTSKQANPVLVPVCHVTYEYKGQQYQLWADGTDPTKITGHPLPTDSGRQMSVWLGYALPLIALVAILLAGVDKLDFMYEMTFGRIAAVGALWIWAYWRQRRIVTHSQEARAYRLATLSARGGGTAAKQTAVYAPSETDWSTRLLTVMAIAFTGYMIWNLGDARPPASPPAAAPVATAVPAAAVAQTSLLPKAVALPTDPQLTVILAAANDQNWNEVHAIAAIMKKNTPLKRGDKAAASVANAHGLKVLLKYQYEAAIQAFQTAVAADPAGTEARDNLVRTYTRIREYEKAIGVTRVLLQTAPENSQAWRRMAEALALSGKQADADAALLLSLHYAKDRNRAVEELTKRAARTADEFGEAATRAVKLAPSIPKAAASKARAPAKAVA